jgi:hypothetical protein
VTVWYISLRYATFCIESDGEKIKKAAPIAGWTVGKSEKYALSYYRYKGAKIEKIQ